MFRERSSQREVLLDWLRRRLLEHRSNRAAPYRLLSVGSGTGSLDAPLIEGLQGVGPVEFVGVDPNALENEPCIETTLALRGFAPHLAPRVIRELAEMGFDVEAEEPATAVDVTPLAAEGPVGDLLLDFIIPVTGLVATQRCDDSRDEREEERKDGSLLVD
jgi:hypothetical protein